MNSSQKKAKPHCLPSERNVAGTGRSLLKGDTLIPKSDLNHPPIRKSSYMFGNHFSENISDKIKLLMENFQRYSWSATKSRCLSQMDGKRSGCYLGCQVKEKVFTVNIIEKLFNVNKKEY